MATFQRGDRVVIVGGAHEGKSGWVVAPPDLVTSRYTVGLFDGEEVSVTPRHLRRRT